ncbi:hypothetical protein ACWGQ5_46350 [Streptomyces sp. NPDC055722]
MPNRRTTPGSSTDALTYGLPARSVRPADDDGRSPHGCTLGSSSGAVVFALPDRRAHR